MVSENRIVNMSQTGSYTSVQWRGDWELFKREMLAAGTLSGLKPALKLSEEVAAQDHEKLEICHEAEMTQLSERLAAILVLALGSTMGPQQSIVVNREAGKEDDGISMWADLIRHFEKGSVDLRKMDLHKSRAEADTADS